MSQTLTARSERTTLVSFDGGVSAPAECLRPDRIRLVEADLGDRPRIARGGGYSYAAASFGAGSLVLEMRRFNRLLRFDPPARAIEVEAGATLGDVLAMTSRFGLGLAIQPGYPAITVGGCVAANVHGKNPSREGTFAGLVMDVTLHHPDHGIVRLTPESGGDLLELTCGGLGLTGVILAATLRLDPLAGRQVSIRRAHVRDPLEAARLSQRLAGESLFAYTWHDATPRPATFGRGFIYQGSIAGEPLGPDGVQIASRALTPEARARLPFSLWTQASARGFASAFWHAEARRPEVTETTLVDALFPFARRSMYFSLFGRPGLAEYQVIVPYESLEGFLHELRRLILSTRAPSVMLSLKAFAGERRLLRFAGDGACVTLDLRRTPAAADFLARLDDLTVAAGGLPNVIKDSRLPQPVVRRCYPGYDAFRERLRAHDKRRLFRSELSERLGL